VTLKLTGLRPLDMKATRRCVPQKARYNPKAPPIAANNTLSVSNCRTSRDLLAPIASRTAISF
jgi:hypothetical protein